MEVSFINVTATWQRLTSTLCSEPQGLLPLWKISSKQSAGSEHITDVVHSAISQLQWPGTCLAFQATLGMIHQFACLGVKNSCTPPLGIIVLCWSLRFLFLWKHACLFKKLILIGVWLLYNIVSVSAGQQSEPDKCLHISRLFWISFPFRSPQSIK